MMTSIRDDRGKRVPISMGSVARQRAKELRRAKGAGEVVIERVPRETLTLRGAGIVFLVFGCVIAWTALVTLGLEWLFSSRPGGSIIDNAVKDLFQRASSPVAVTVVVLGFLLIVVCLGLPPQLLMVKVFGPSLFGPRLRKVLYLRRCPSCDYTLPADAIQPDGCTLCPECGAAWRIPAGAITTDASKTHR